MLLSKNSGMVLVITLWLVTILAIFGIGLARLAWSGAYFTRWRINKTLSPYAMNTVMMMTKYRMAKDKTPEYDIHAWITGVMMPDGMVHWNVNIEGEDDMGKAAGILERAVEVLSDKDGD